jgi:hypothetical protein
VLVNGASASTSLVHIYRKRSYVIDIIAAINAMIVYVWRYSRRLECLRELVFELPLVVDSEYSDDRNADGLVRAHVLKQMLTL